MAAPSTLHPSKWHLHISPKFIPSIHWNPVRFLGRNIVFTLSDSSSLAKFNEELISGLFLIDRSFHSGSQKSWILQHLLIPRLRWSLLIYEVHPTIVIQLEKKVSVYLRKWLRIHGSTSNLCLYSNISPCSFPIKSLSSVFKSSKSSGYLLLRESSDPNVPLVDPLVRAGNWDIARSVSEAESEIQFQQILGPAQSNRAGLRSTKFPTVPPKNTHQYRKLISETIGNITTHNDMYGGREE